MKYTCTFLHPKTRERREVIVDLAPTEIAGEQHELIGMAYALQRAYRDVPRGFLHDQVERVRLH